MIAIPPYAQRVRTARALGEDRMQRGLDVANAVDKTFSERAYTFFVSYINDQFPVVGGVPGETVTLAAKQAGIVAPDDRAFGAIFAKALRLRAIKIVGECRRVRGHGTAGGHLYGPGDSLEEGV